jgi:hypothetical protein
MSTIITKNSANSGSTPSLLVQGELAINVTDGRLFYGSGSGNVVKEFGITASYAIDALSASYAETASYAPDYLPLTGGTINGDVTVNGTASIAFLNVSYESASVIYSSGSNQFGDASNDVQTLYGTVDIKTGPVLVTGSLDVSEGITGSLLGTASYAINALSSSYALTSTSASHAENTDNAISSSYALTASYVENAQTASYVQTAQTASYVQTAQTASYVLQAVSASFATTASYSNTSTSASHAVNADSSISSSYSNTSTSASHAVNADNTISSSYALTSSYVENAQTASFVTLAQTASYVENAQTASYVENAQTASYVENAQTASYVLQTVSSSFASTASYVNTLNQIVRVGNKIELDNTSGGIIAESFDAGLGNVVIDGSAGTVAATTFIGDLTGTASYATQALSASYAPSAGGAAFPFTGSASITGSLELTGSFSVQDINGKTNIDSFDRKLYDAGPPFPPGASSVLSIDWGSRTLNDSNGVSAIAWRDRALYTPNATTAIIWSDNTYLSSDVYQRDYKSAATQDAVSTNSAAYLGDVIESDGSATVIDAAVTEGMLVYLDTNTTWYPVDQANTRASYLLGIAHNLASLPPPPIGPANQTGWILLEGHVVIDDTATTGPYVAGAGFGLPIYIEDSTTTGTMSTTVPTTTGGTYVVRVLGHCYQQNTNTTTQWMMKFRPSNDWVEI